MEFYLSKGNLKYLFSKKSNFNAACGSVGDVSGNLICLDFDKDFTIVQCKKIQTFDSTVYGDLTLVTLNDGIEEKPAVILKSTGIQGASNNLKYDLKNGSIILIRGISFHSFSSLGFDVSEESEIDINQRVMLIEKYQFMGFESCLSEDEDTESEEIVNKSEDKVNKSEDIVNKSEDIVNKSEDIEKINNAEKSNEKVLHIDKLDEFSDNFILKVCFEKKTPISTFQSNANCHKIRAKLVDNSGAIEMVAFHSDCKRIEELELYKWYLIDNICINKKNRKFSAWPSDQTVEYDLMVKNETNFYLTEGPNLETIKNQFSEKRFMAKEENSKVTSVPTTVNYTNDTKINLNNFITIDKLARCKLNDMVNIIAIVIKVDELTNKQFTDGRESIVIRNVTVIDKSNHSAILAFWGKDARNFQMQIGTPIVIKSALVTLFNGLTLSIIKKSTFYANCKSSKSEIVEIKDWYKNFNPVSEIPIRSVVNKGARVINGKAKISKKNF